MGGILQAVSPLIWVSRSAIETRQRCPRKRFINYHFPTPVGNGGIQPIKESLPKLRGKKVHDAFSQVVSNPLCLEEAIQEMHQSYRDEVEEKGVELMDNQQHFLSEQLHLVECVLRGWTKVRLPLLLEEWEHLTAEEEWEYEVAPGVVIPIRMDWIVRHQGTGQIATIDYKTASSLSFDWQLKWEKDLQTEIYVNALREMFPHESVAGIIYEGLEVGTWKVESGVKSPFNGQRIQQSPYCYGYRKKDSSQPKGWLAQAKYSSSIGWEKFFVPSMYGSEEWILQLEKEGKLEQLFCHIPPIHPPVVEMESLRAQVVDQELEWGKHLQHYFAIEDPTERERYLDYFAPQHLHECLKFGIDHKCSFRGTVCFNDGALPLEDGGFTLREDHHKLEERYD